MAVILSRPQCVKLFIILHDEAQCSLLAIDQTMNQPPACSLILRLHFTPLSIEYNQHT